MKQHLFKSFNFLRFTFKRFPWQKGCVFTSLTVTSFFLTASCFLFTASSVLFIPSFTFAQNDPFKVIGENDLRFVQKNKLNIPFKYWKTVDAIGMMDMGCTVTHIGRGYALTAGHCFWTGLFGPVKDFIVRDQECKDDFDQTYTISWGWRSDIGDIEAEPAFKSNCSRIIFAKLTRHSDIALIRVENPPTAFVQVDLTADYVKVGGRPVTVFSHADNSPLQWAGNCRVKRMQVPTISTRSLIHVCDTSPGSSGATIIDTETLKIVGVHAGGVYYSDLKGDFAGDPFSDDPVSDEELKLGINYGTYMTDPEIHTILKSLGF